MKVKCEYCDNYYDGEATECPHCGAPNEHIRRTANNVPHTIDELRGWAEQFNLPLSDMRVHIGEDYRGPKAFGIYKDGEKVVVYKNKANGERAVRYEGTDEAYAVHELYQKMRELLNESKRTSAAPARTTVPVSNNSTGSRKRRHPIITVIVIVYIVMMAMSVGVNLISMFVSAATGYSRSYGGYSDYDYYDPDYGYYDDYDYDYDYYDSGSSYDYDSSWDYDWDDYDWDYDYDWDSGWDWDSDW